MGAVPAHRPTWVRENRSAPVVEPVEAEKKREAPWRGRRPGPRCSWSWERCGAHAGSWPAAHPAAPRWSRHPRRWSSSSASGSRPPSGACSCSIPPASGSRSVTCTSTAPTCVCPSASSTGRACTRSCSGSCRETGIRWSPVQLHVRATRAAAREHRLPRPHAAADPGRHAHPGRGHEPHTRARPARHRPRGGRPRDRRRPVGVAVAQPRVVDRRDRPPTGVRIPARRWRDVVGDAAASCQAGRRRLRRPGAVRRAAVRLRAVRRRGPATRGWWGHAGTVGPANRFSRLAAGRWASWVSRASSTPCCGSARSST